VTAGVGIYSTLTESMELYRQRAQGIIDIGMQLDLQFDKAGHTINTLRDRYQVLAHDSIAAMQAMGRVTGGFTGIDDAVRFGVAYGITPAHAATMAGTLQMLSGGTNPLARAAQAARQESGGRLPMEMGALLEGVTQVAGVGGPSASGIDPAFYGRMLGLITQMGPGYRLPGAAAQFYGQFAAGVGPSADPVTRMVRQRALDRLMRERQDRGLGPQLQIGTHTVDLSTYVGRQQAMVLAAQSPEILEAYNRQADLLGPDPTTRALAFNRLIGGGKLDLVQSEDLRKLAGRGGFARLGMPGGGLSEDAIAAERLAARQGRPEFATQLAQALSESGLEKLGAPLVQASNELRQALVTLAEVIRDGKFGQESLERAMTALSTQTMLLMGSIISLGSNSTVGQLLGASMLAAGAGAGIVDSLMNLPGLKSGWSRFHVAAPEGFDPAGSMGYPSLTPQRPAP
jgi:hypothetical protein